MKVLEGNYGYYEVESGELVTSSHLASRLQLEQAILPHLVLGSARLMEEFNKWNSAGEYWFLGFGSKNMPNGDILTTLYAARKGHYYYVDKETGYAR